MIEIKMLNKSGLRTYIESAAFQNSPVIAISRHRAESHILNPRAQDTDVLLLLAFEDENMVGYLGVLPDDIRTENNSFIHCGWMSCLWIDPNHRGKKIAQKLIEACFQSWDNKILLTEYTEAAGALYQKLNIFSFFHTCVGRRWYIRSDLRTILPPKKKIFTDLKLLLKGIDGFLNVFINGLHLFKNQNLNGYQLSMVTSVEKEAVEMIRKSITEELFARTVDELNWILQYPWILSGEFSEKETQKYHFTSVEKTFECKGVEIRNDKNVLVAFIIYTNRNGHLRLPYIYHNEENEALRLVCRNLIQDLKIKTCTIYHQEFIEYLAIKPLFSVPNKVVQRKYLISKTLMNQGLKRSFKIQDGDGDCAFT